MVQIATLETSRFQRLQRILFHAAASRQAGGDLAACGAAAWADGRSSAAEQPRCSGGRDLGFCGPMGGGGAAAAA